MRRWVGSIAAVALLGLAGSAGATVYPDTNTFVTSGGTTTSNPLSTTVGGSSATVTLGPVPMVTATASNGTAFAKLHYLIDLNVDPTLIPTTGSGTISTPITIDYSGGVTTGAVSPGNSRVVSSKLYIYSEYDGSYPLAILDDCTSSYNSSSGACMSHYAGPVTFTFNAIFYTNPGGGFPTQLYPKSLRVEMEAYASSSNGQIATAFVDPIFSLPVNSPFTLTVSQGVGNGPAALAAVPEPATWAMLVIGFGAVGGAIRRRRPVAATA